MENKKVKDKVTEEELVLYFGENSLTFLDKFNRIKNKDISFNFASAFFGVFYLLYRKMYLSAIVALLLSMILPANLISTILMFLILGFATDYAYYYKVNYEIERIKKIKQSASIKKELIRQYGGTNLLGPLVISMITLLSLIILMFCGFFTVFMI